MLTRRLIETASAALARPEVTEDGMRLSQIFSRSPLAFANTLLIIVIYVVLGAIVISTRGRITGDDVAMIWPLHIIFAINLLAIFGPSKPR